MNLEKHLQKYSKEQLIRLYIQLFEEVQKFDEEYRSVKREPVNTKL